MYHLEEDVDRKGEVCGEGAELYGKSLYLLNFSGNLKK